MNPIYIFAAVFLFWWTVETHANCKEDNWDVWKVTKALSQGISKETLLEHIEGSRNKIDPARMEKIKKIVEEVYRLDQSQAEAYWKSHHKECPPESDARGPFIRAEALENVNPAKRYAQCAEYLSDHAFLGKAIKHGRDCDQMKEWTSTIPDVPDERRAKIARLLDEACAAPNVEEWFDVYYRKCMK